MLLIFCKDTNISVHGKTNLNNLMFFIYRRILKIVQNSNTHLRLRQPSLFI